MDHGGPDGNLWFSESDNGSIGRITVGGDITTFMLRFGQGIIGRPGCGTSVVHRLREWSDRPDHGWR